MKSLETKIAEMQVELRLEKTHHFKWMEHVVVFFNHGKDGWDEFLKILGQKIEACFFLRPFSGLK